MKNKGFFNVRTTIVSFILFMCMLALINGSPFGLAKLADITGGQSILDMEMMKGYSVPLFDTTMLHAIGAVNFALN